MFTGIVKGKGRVVETTATAGDRRLVIATDGLDLGGIGPGDSIAVNGVCLTATDPQTDRFAADVSAETLACTTLGRLEAGAAVNLESALKLGQTLDGHIVSGHVDGVARVTAIAEAARSLALTIALPGRLARYVAVKGSITVDGVSLTVNAVDLDGFTVNIIPHTRQLTIISGYRVGTPVNIEVDMIARYLERLLTAGPIGVTRASLERHGFIESD